MTNEKKTKLDNETKLDNVINAKVEKHSEGKEVGTVSSERIKSAKPVEKKEEVPVVSTRKFKEIRLPDYKEFLKAGVQFGHQTNKWNPRMKRYIYSSKNNIHVLDLNKTLESLSEALKALQETSYKSSVLFVGTKSQVKNIVKDEAVRSGAFFVTNRWAGGLLSNFKTLKKSLDRLNELEKMFEEGVQNRTKQEISWMKKDWERLNRLYGGVKGMKSLPGIVFIMDVTFEQGAVKEANTLNIPIVGVCDTNSNPDGIRFPIPSNDDAIGAIKLITGLAADAVLDGNQGGGVKHIFKDYSRMEVEAK